MIVNAGLAHLSDLLFDGAATGYVLALVAFCGEYALGAPRRADTASAPEAEPALVGAAAAGGHDHSALPEPAGRGPGESGAAGGGGGRVTRAGAARLGAWCGRVAVGCVAVGAVLHAGSVLARGLSVHRLPWGNMYEFTSAMVLVAVVGFLTLLARAPQTRGLGLFVLFPVVVLVFLAGTVLYTRPGPLVAALHSYWLAIHVTAAIVATGVFLVSGVASVLFLVRQRHDRLAAAGSPAPRQPTALGWRLPPAPALDTLAYRTIAFGFPIWTFGIICGAIWAEAAWGRYWGWDPKETWAFIAWVIYAGYLHARATAGWRGTRAAVINLLGFAAMTFNFFVVNVVISGLHSYAGLG